MKKDMDLDGKVALITGATGCIGSATAERLAECGADIVIVDLDQEETVTFGAHVAEKFAVKAMGFGVDVRDYSRIDEIIAEVSAELGPVTVLVNNAAKHHEEPILETEVELFEEVIAVNLVACWYLIKKVAPGMIEVGGGTIVNISSTIAFGGGRGTGGAAYIASKGALNALTQAAAREFGPHGIRVNAIAPGYVATPFYYENRERIDAALKASTALQKPAMPADIANTVAFLASDASSVITGDILSVNSGMTMR